MVPAQRQNFSQWIKNTPKRQFEKKQFVTKLIILLAVFCVVFIPSFILYSRISNGMNAMQEHWWRGNLLYLQPEWNWINNSYKIWNKLSKLTNNWLIVVQFCVAILGLLVLGVCWCYVNNHVAFSFSMFIYISVMFNCVDACCMGTVLDYIKVQYKHGWFEYLFLWPSFFPALLNGTQLTAGIFNLPDFFIALGVYGIIFTLLTLGIIEIVKSHKYKVFIEKTIVLANLWNKKET